MIDVFYIGQSMNLPAYRFVVRDQDGPVNLSAVTSAYFCMMNISTGSIIVSALVTITDAFNGEGEYDWSVADTAVVGEYAASVLFVEAGGSYSLPRSMMAKVVVEDTYVT